MPGFEELSREELIAALTALTSAFAELQVENARLCERIGKLERQVSRNSGNSLLPPSGDDRPGKPQPKGRAVPGSGRSRGKQPGAAGTALAWSDRPDEVKPLFPAECGNCGSGLEGAACTDRYTAYHLGGRDTGTFTAFGIGAGFTGYAVRDRYDPYDRGVLKTCAGTIGCQLSVNTPRSRSWPPYVLAGRCWER